MAHRNPHPGPDCRTTIKRGDYPYECVAKDKRPDAKIAQCHTHYVWWEVVGDAD